MTNGEIQLKQEKQEREGGRYFNFDLQLLVLVGILIVVVIVSALLTPNFLTYPNLINVLTQVVIVMLIGSAAVYLMISGNFDLSVGAVLAFTGVMFAYMSKNGIPTDAAFILAILIGAVFGIINGLLVVQLGITPVIATLGTMYVARGMAFIVAYWDGGANINSGLPLDFADFGTRMVGAVPMYLIVMLLIVLFMGTVFARMNIVKYAFAIGSNKTAALLSGVKYGGVVLALYILVGAFAGLSGATVASRIVTGAPKVGVNLEFEVIVAIVLGGTSIYGGEGSFWGMVLGALIVGLVGNTLNLLDVPFFYQIVLNGIVLVGAILLSRIIKERFT